ncbi:alpha-ketoglutarate-dependent dioxygenase AlkB family protein [Polynucleobacter arcticus]|uniref:Alpha-ketoglutarate-dependent dioxygenase AlkB n=1 Tax=Polynucleobacter arcticus TaxID=1743165 RepID=A0A6M9PNI3_9BURK|nr:alpha-ketoglutarate-dependent dioxygenase AlkB [Polynucleobacter arcticus]QKM60928.1 alpha-ketoglutarate-dependent dioxygenase AlkB [Polynucleobacter arcticus]
MQNLLFQTQSPSEPIVILAKDGRAEYFNHFYDADTSDHLFEKLLSSLSWESDRIQMFGKLVTTSRKVAWVGDPDCSYTYSGVPKQPQNWTDELLQIKQKLEQVTGHTYNSCLLNLYHTGQEGMGWHSDDEKELDNSNPIASISLGARRKFAFRHKQDKTTNALFLENGSLLIMHPPIQEYWHHSLLKTKTVMSPRINLTFRKILSKI